MPVQDDANLLDYNVDYYINFTLSAAQQWAANYRPDADGTKHVLWSMGESGDDVYRYRLLRAAPLSFFDALYDDTSHCPSEHCSP